MARIIAICAIPGIMTAKLFIAQVKIATGINVTINLKIMRFGSLMFNPFTTITALNSQYKKFVKSVAMPTPINPNCLINRIFNATPAIPETNFIINPI